MKRFDFALIATIAVAAVYLTLWPLPIEPVAWQAPPNPGYTGPFAWNERLKAVEIIPLADTHGPEDIALGPDGLFYAATHEGWIVRFNSDGEAPERWKQTGGRPLGIDFDAGGNLIVAEAYRGLLRIAPDGTISLLTDEAGGVGISYADDVDIAADGKIYFSDASTKFAPPDYGGTYPASLVDLIEHGGHGRLLVYDPRTQEAQVLIDGLQFANGVAVDPAQRFVLVNETGMYRVLRYWLVGEKAGTRDVLIDELPGFPDNISAGLDGRFWVGFASPRSTLLDNFAGKPFARKLVQRLPGFMRPGAQPYGHIIAIDADGNVLEDLQDPDAAYPVITGVLELADRLYLGSLVAPGIGWLAKDKAGLK